MGRVGHHTTGGMDMKCTGKCRCPKCNKRRLKRMVRQKHREALLVQEAHDQGFRKGEESMRFSSEYRP